MEFNSWPERCTRVVVTAALAIALIMSPCMSSASGLTPLHFATVDEMIEHYGDYSAQERTYQLLAQSPLKIQLAVDVMPGDYPQNIQRDLRRAVLYGVFRTLVHTSTNELTVIAVPRELATPAKILDKPSITINITRDQALLAASSFMTVKTSADLVKPAKMGPGQVDNWVPTFEKLYFSDSGQEQLLQAIRVAGGDVLSL